MGQNSLARMISVFVDADNTSLGKPLRFML